jgi:hypothetical protein
LEWDLVAQCHMDFHPVEERNDNQLKRSLTSSQRSRWGRVIPLCPLMSGMPRIFVG